MNRRRFLKALAATSLLGLVAKFPEMEGELDLAELEEALAAVADSAEATASCLQELGASVQEAKHWMHISGRALFVDPVSGRDDNSGLAPPLSLATIQRALEVLEEESPEEQGWVVVLGRPGVA